MDTARIELNKCEGIELNGYERIELKNEYERIELNE